MLALIAATILSLPIYPLNPTVQDTVNTMNLHITAGVAGPSGVISAGPEVTVKYEYLFNHPFILRTSFDYRFGQVTSNKFPNGKVHRETISAEAIYYHGADRMTGYIGMGIVAGFNTFLPDDESFEQLGFSKDNTDLDMSWALGYRFTLGLRIRQVYSIEVGITEISPSFIYREHLSPTKFTEEKTEFRANDFKVSFGYLIEL